MQNDYVQLHAVCLPLGVTEGGEKLLAARCHSEFFIFFILSSP